MFDLHVAGPVMQLIYPIIFAKELYTTCWRRKRREKNVDVAEKRRMLLPVAY